jgi:hypothetical protein
MIASPLSVYAGYIQSDIFTVFDGTGAIRYQFGVTEDGSLLGSAACLTFSSTPCSSNEPGDGTLNGLNIFYLPVSNLVDTNQFGHGRQLQESDGTISDGFGIANFGNDYFLFFYSDADTGSLPVPAVPSPIVETDQPVDATVFLATNLQAQGWTATFQSADIHVPEPITLALFGLGLAGLGFSRRKQA